MTDNIKRNENYSRYVNAISPSSSALSSLIKAFIAGGITCVIGEIVRNTFGLMPGITDEQAAVYASVVLSNCNTVYWIRNL